MKENCTDKRIIKTKYAIRTAFKKIILSKDLSEISISELTKEASITRSTFYMYYNTVSDVRDDIENLIVEKLDEMMTDKDIASAFVNPYYLLSSIANEILKYDETNKYILNESNSGRLLDKLNNKMVEKFTDFVNRNKMGDAAKLKYIVIFFSSGIFECFKMWYNHQSTLTLEDLCMRISNFINKGMAVTSLNN